jgi:hypothetical protein
MIDRGGGLPEGDTPSGLPQLLGKENEKTGMGQTRTKAAKRTVRFALQLTPEEREELERRATSAGVNASTYLRAAFLERQLPQRTTALATDTYRELSRIGSNINQIARAANTTVKMGLPVNVNLDELEQLRQLLWQVHLEVRGVDRQPN